MWMETTVIREHEFYRISRNIIVVAVKGAVDDWAAYIGIIKGSADENWQIVWRDGNKIRYKIAKAMFPEFSKKYTWRS